MQQRSFEYWCVFPLKNRSPGYAPIYNSYIQESLETGAPLDLIEFTDREVKELVKALKVSKVLHRVNLDCSQITDCGANYLAEVLKESDCVLTGNIKNIKIMLPPQF